MRLLKAELKRILKSSRSMGLIVIGICLSVLLAIVPVLFVSADIRDAHGNVRELNGISAIRYWREIYKPFDGEVTPEKLKSALTTYQDCVKKNMETRIVRVFRQTFTLRRLHLYTACFDWRR